MRRSCRLFGAPLLKKLLPDSLKVTRFTSIKKLKISFPFSHRSAAGIINRRKGLQNAYSSVNLTTAGQDESSSEESPPPNAPISNKPAVPPRPRNIPPDQRRIANVNSIISAKKMELAANMAELPCKDSDLENADCKNFTEI